MYPLGMVIIRHHVYWKTYQVRKGYCVVYLLDKDSYYSEIEALYVIVHVVSLMVDIWVYMNQRQTLLLGVMVLLYFIHI